MTSERELTDDFGVLTVRLTSDLSVDGVGIRATWRQYYEPAILGFALTRLLQAGLPRFEPTVAPPPLSAPARRLGRTEYELFRTELVLARNARLRRWQRAIDSSAAAVEEQAADPRRTVVVRYRGRWFHEVELAVDWVERAATQELAERLSAVVGTHPLVLPDLKTDGDDSDAHHLASASAILEGRN